MHRDNFLLIELSFEPSEDGIVGRHAEKYLLFRQIVYGVLQKYETFFVGEDENIKALSVWECSPER